MSCIYELKLDYSDSFLNIVMMNCGNLFWKDVAKHFKTLCAKFSPSDADSLMAEPIHYNIRFIRGNHVVYVREWADAGILYVRDLMNRDTGDFFTHDEFKKKYSALRNVNFILVEGIIQCIRNYQCRAGIILRPSITVQQWGVWKVIKGGNVLIKSVMLKDDELPTASIKWNSLYNGLRGDYYLERGCIVRFHSVPRFERKCPLNISFHR